MPVSCGSSQFSSVQCRCRLGQKSKSRWHQPRRAVLPGRLGCSRSSFLAPSMLPLFDPQGTWDGTDPCGAGVGPASRWGRWIASSGNVVSVLSHTRSQVATTSHRRLATGRNSRLLQEFVWPCSLSIVESLGEPSPNISPQNRQAPIATLPLLSPPTFSKSYSNRQPSFLPQDLHLPLHI